MTMPNLIDYSKEINLVIFPDYILERKYANTPNGVLRLYTLLKMAGFSNVRLHDFRHCNSDDDLEIAVKMATVDVACSYWLLSAVSCQGNLVTNISNFIKYYYPHHTIALGGMHVMSIIHSPSWDKKRLMQIHPNVKTFVSGFVWNILDMLGVMDYLFNYTGHFYNTGRVQPDPNDIVLPLDYNVLGDKAFSLEGGWIRKTETLQVRQQNMMASAGCKFKCAFCSNPYNETHNAPVEMVVDELKRRNQEYGVNSIKFDDDDIMQNLDWNDKFLNELEKANLDMKYLIQTRCDIHREGYRKLAQMIKFNDLGLKVAGVGVECPSDEVLKNINKGLNVKNIKLTIDALNQYTDIEVLTYIILGLPPFTEDVVAEIKDFIYWCKGRVKHLLLTSFTPLINTPIYENPKKFGGRLLVPQAFDDKIDWNDFYFFGEIDRVRYFPTGVMYKSEFIERKLEIYKVAYECGFLREETINDIEKAGYTL